LTGFLASVTTGALLIACSAVPAPDADLVANETAAIAVLPAATIVPTPTIALATTQPIEETIDGVETDVQYIQTLADVNLRGGPGTNYATVGSVFAGQLILVTGTTPNNR